MMLIKAENLHKVYKEGKRDLNVLKGIDICLEPKSLSAIIGPSGAGKSTLIHILGGLDSPSKGKVLFDGMDLYGISEARRSLIRNRRIGFVFQFYHLLQEFNALENVMMPALIRPSSANKNLLARAKGLLVSVGLDDRMNHTPGELSGGEAQRVAIARALINEPDIVFCDEPTGNLDSANAGTILGLIAELNRNNGQAFLVVTHDARVAAVADKLMHIKDGLLAG